MCGLHRSVHTCAADDSSQIGHGPSIAGCILNVVALVDFLKVYNTKTSMKSDMPYSSAGIFHYLKSNLSCGIF